MMLARRWASWGSRSTKPSMASCIRADTPACDEVIIGRPQAIASATGRAKESSRLGLTVNVGGGVEVDYRGARGFPMTLLQNAEALCLFANGGSVVVADDKKM